ncbi:TetR/AcrR family transcriptional regulator [Nakamurella flavida]|uniref:TetR/AcrR family transcriptional regulator n=1 Tax=Nakamurella flavida TaxID=363630 RepID=A0A938YNQ5_9ACTN|nr:TetR/AcrR family transcriptional regulator [Nakamurella flavida]MBM9478098.1 TetR/AcrR family transcriptional regulator [Nakamurella flavida]MDP9778681.1 AcrR family transcriptional regulator [Nakamurella flavida]
MPPVTVARAPSARDRLLAAADELFYAEGVNSVGIDRIIEHAGVAKASLYSTFGSKDELVRAYLQGRHQARVDRITRELADITDPRERVLAVFDGQARAFAAGTFRGCAFLNAAAEARSGTAVQAVAEEYRRWLRDLFRDLLTEVGVADPAGLAGQLVLLYDGAGVGAKMDRGIGSTATARTVAAILLDTAPLTNAS